MRHRKVERILDAQAWQGARPREAKVLWRYTAVDPWAVTIRIAAGRRHVDWRFSRELLDEGLLAGDGIGDVEITPAAANTVVVTLHPTHNGGRRLDLILDNDDVCDFLDATKRLVPPGSERVDIDAELARILETS